MSAVDTARDALFGNPPDPTMEPSREGLLAALTELQAGVTRAALGSLVDVAYPTRAELDADLAYEADTVALVYADATDANNDLYTKVGSSGTGSWTLTSILHDAIGGLAQPYVDDAAASAASATAASSQITTTIRTGAGRQLYRLKRALANPLVQFLGVVLLGDSITWGLTTTGQATSTPRSGVLADPRNNATSPSWANLLHTYLGSEYYRDNGVTATAWPGSGGGVAVFSYNRTVDLFPYGGMFANTNVGSVGTWGVTTNAGALTGRYLQATVGSSSDDLITSFTFTGYEFDHYFAALSDGANYEVHVNGVALPGPYTTNTADLGGADRFSEHTTIDLGGFVQEALIEIKVVPGVAGRTVFRTEAIRVNRVLRITNQGIIGADTASYASLVATAVQEGDQFGSLMLGTNNRLLQSTPNGFHDGLSDIVRSLQDDHGLDVILMCANATANEPNPPYYFTMNEVRGVIASVADDFGCDFVDHYGPTKALIDDGDTTWLADDPHPGDAGHDGIYQRFHDAIEQSAAR